jgi:hypothetical protein
MSPEDAVVEGGALRCSLRRTATVGTAADDEGAVDDRVEVDDWWPRTPTSAVLATRRAARMVDRARRAAVRSGSR